jgi:hypothetical protein
MANKKKAIQEEVQKRTVKSYAILGLVCLLFIGLILYLCKWYDVYDQYQKEIPVIRDSLQEIVSDDLEHYVLENPNSLIYICTSSDEQCRNFEKKFKKLIEKEELGDEIIYLNVTDVDQEAFVNNFNAKYAKKKQLTTNYPAIVLFDEGKAVRILQAKKDKKLNIDDVKHFIKLNEEAVGE